MRFLRPVGKSREKQTNLVGKYHFKEYLDKLDIYKLMTLDEMHLQSVGELNDVILRSFLIIFESLCCLAEMPKFWKKENFTPPFIKGNKEDVENYSLSASFPSL